VPAEVDKALLANPNDRMAFSWLTYYYQMNGDYPQAIQQAKLMTTRWPVYWPGNLALGEMLLEQGDTAGAVQIEERILEQDPQNMQALSYVARAQMGAGDLPRARSALERARPEDRKNFRFRQHWALLLALEGKKAEALREMDSEVQAYAATFFRGPLLAAEFYAVMGDAPKALEWLDRAGRMGDDREAWLRRDSLLAGIRDQPRFQQILASMAYRRSQRPVVPPSPSR
jgi:tetratricopeptide (TPR) repeat protein